MLNALKTGMIAAQKLIIQDETQGTLTTLVACLIAPEAPPAAEKHSLWRFRSSAGSDDGSSSRTSSSSDLETQEQQQVGSSSSSSKWSWSLMHPKRHHHRHEGKQQQQQQQQQGEEADQDGSCRYVVCSLMVGDSPAFVWRHRAGQVEEISAATNTGPLTQHR